MIDRLAKLVQSRPRTIAIVAAVLFAAAGALGSGVAERLDPYEATDADTESVIADRALENAGYRETSVVVLIEGVDPRSAAGRERVAEVTETIAAQPEVAETVSFLDGGSADLVSRTGDATYIGVLLEPTDNGDLQDAAEHIVDAFAGEPGVTVGGPAVANLEVNEQVESDLQRAEMLAFPILFLLALLFFRSVVAALLPLMVGALAIAATFFMLRVASEMGSISVFALNLVIGLGLGLAIDYSLFIVSRYREELARSGPGLEAMRRTLATAGRTVFFSALTVAGAAASLIVFPQNFLYSMGIGGVIVALIAATIALIVLPAVLALLGERVNALAPAFLQRRAARDAQVTEEGFWYRLSRTVMRFPGRIAIASAVVLIALALPFLGIRFTSVDAQVLPPSASARQVDDVLRADFPPFRDTPSTLAVSGSAAEAEDVAAAAAELPGVGGVAPPVELEGDVHAIQVYSSAPPLDETSKELVHDLRGLEGSPQVTGATAGFLDLQSSLGHHLPFVLAVIAAVTLIILFLFTGSVILPLKQLLMNLLGISAVFGILVLVFQDGRFEGLLGYTSQGALESTQPLLLFAIGFGLATDYGVFLLSRIKEARDEGLSDSEAVAVGLERTGRIVTAAALLFAIAVGAFVTSEIIFIKQLGLGTALIVLIDATIIRALLVPSLMEMLGRWNWWAPRPLRRLHARFGLSDAAARPAAHPAD